MSLNANKGEFIEPNTIFSETKLIIFCSIRLNRNALVELPLGWYPWPYQILPVNFSWMTKPSLYLIVSQNMIGKGRLHTVTVLKSAQYSPAVGKVIKQTSSNKDQGWSSVDCFKGFRSSVLLLHLDNHDGFNTFLWQPTKRYGPVRGPAEDFFLQFGQKNVIILGNFGVQ